MISADCWAIFIQSRSMLHENHFQQKYLSLDVLIKTNQNACDHRRDNKRSMIVSNCLENLAHEHAPFSSWS